MTTIEAIPNSSPASDDSGVLIQGRIGQEYREILTPDAIEFLAALARRFEGRRRDILRSRAIRQHEIDYGQVPDFPTETAWVRDTPWTVAPIPCDLLDRRVEISGPVDRKTLVTALNSGANLYMADFEDGNSPTWDNNIRGQLNLRDAVDGVIGYETPDGEFCRVNGRAATLAVRPRGWHMVEKGLLVDGRPISASLFDFGLYFYHNADNLVARGKAPYFYLPKLESYFEARLWNDVFNFAQDSLGVDRGSIRATVIIENILAAFQMDEILFELREHAAGLRHDHWNYVFSLIGKFRDHPDFTVPDRCALSADQPSIRASVELLIRVCHRRGIHAIGGKPTQNPAGCNGSTKPALFEEIMKSMQSEAALGFDGTQVMHAALVPLAKGVYDAAMPEAHQIDRQVRGHTITPNDLLALPNGDLTERNIRDNIQVTIRYLGAWLGGRGRMSYNGRLEDAASAEISRSQVWQWQRHGARLEDGRPVTRALVQGLIREEIQTIRDELSPALAAAERYDLAATITADLMTARTFPEFMTETAYEYLS